MFEVISVVVSSFTVGTFVILFWTFARSSNNSFLPPPPGPDFSSFFLVTRKEVMLPRNVLYIPALTRAEYVRRYSLYCAGLYNGGSM